MQRNLRVTVPVIDSEYCNAQGPQNEPQTAAAYSIQSQTALVIS